MRTAPEVMWVRWQRVQDILLDEFGAAPEKGWQRAVSAVFVGSEAKS